MKSSRIVTCLKDASLIPELQREAQIYLGKDESNSFSSNVVRNERKMWLTEQGLSFCDLQVKPNSEKPHLPHGPHQTWPQKIRGSESLEKWLVILYLLYLISGGRGELT